MENFEYEKLSPIGQLRVTVLEKLIFHFTYSPEGEDENFEALVKRLFVDENFNPNFADFALNTLLCAQRDHKPIKAGTFQDILDTTLESIKKTNDVSARKARPSDRNAPISGGRSGKQHDLTRNRVGNKAG